MDDGSRKGLFQLCRWKTDEIVVQDVPDPEKPETWSFQLQWTWKRQDGENTTSLPWLKERAKNIAEPFHSAFLWLPDDTVLSENKLTSWEPRPFDTKGGRITLVGDAGHPMTFRTSSFCIMLDLTR